MLAAYKSSWSRIEGSYLALLVHLVTSTRKRPRRVQCRCSHRRMTHITLCNLHVFIVRSISNRAFRLSSHVLAMLSISGRDFHGVYLAPMISRARIADRVRVSQHDRKAQGNDVNRFQFHMETYMDTIFRYLILIIKEIHSDP